MANAEMNKLHVKRIHLVGCSYIDIIDYRYALSHFYLKTILGSSPLLSSKNIIAYYKK
jgi:hypothetical protein